jgi:hypothetical protein
MPRDYEKEEWVRLYQNAMLGLEQAKTAGQIGDARTEITARIEKLREIPGLHEREKQALEDALHGLRVLEREGERASADERRIAEATIEKLRILEPKLGNR